MFRVGDGNEGNCPRFLVDLADGQCPFAALSALVVNRYIVGSRTRRHVMQNLQTEGDTEYGVHLTVYEGPKGERAFDAAWLTAELEPYTEEDCARTNAQRYALLDCLDTAAVRYFNRLNKEGV